MDIVESIIIKQVKRQGERNEKHKKKIDWDS